MGEYLSNRISTLENKANLKKIILIFILIFTALNGFSKCASSGLYFWPTKPTISQNSIFVIDGYATSQEIINGLGSVYKVFLKSKTQKIKLAIQELLVGQYSLTQAVLKPETALSMGEEYELLIENLGDSEGLVSKYNSTTGQREKIKWTIIKNDDTIPPSWTTIPKYTNSTNQMYGCGPATFVDFSFSAIDSSEFLIRTTVKNMSTQKETTYYLTSTEKTISIGHSMCSGAFNFNNGSKFEVEFSLFDASGNITKWTGDRIPFKSPT
jgi:hypothetical protein